MFIRKSTVSLKCTIGITDHNLKIIIPSQYIEYDIIEKNFIQPNVKIIFKFKYESTSDAIETTVNWSLTDFSKFVDEFLNGVNNIKEIATPFLKDNKNFEAFFKISDSIFIKSEIISEDVSSGLFKKPQYEDVIKIRFWMPEEPYWGEKRWITYDKEMLKPLIELIDDFIEQINTFKQQINDIKSKK